MTDVGNILLLLKLQSEEENIQKCGVVDGLRN